MRQQHLLLMSQCVIITTYVGHIDLVEVCFRILLVQELGLLEHKVSV